MNLVRLSIAIAVAAWPFIASPTSAAQKQPDMVKAVCAKARDESSYESSSMVFLVPGRDGFLFSTRIDMRDYLPINWKSQATFVEIINTLRGVGTEVVLVVPPPRAVVDQKFLLPDEVDLADYNLASAEAGYEAMLEGLRANGVLVADVLGKAHSKATRVPFYLRRDIHWSSEGARISAAAAADVIKGLPAFAEVRTEAFRTSEVSTIKSDENLSEALTQICSKAITAERVPIFRTIAVDEQGSLFDDKPFDVVLIGTSFSKRGDDDPNFSGFLQQELSTRVYNAAREGSGMEGAMAEYLTSDAFRTRKPKVIVWEFPPYERPDVDDGEPTRTVADALHQSLRP